MTQPSAKLPTREQLDNLREWASTHAFTTRDTFDGVLALLDAYEALTARPEPAQPGERVITHAEALHVLQGMVGSVDCGDMTLARYIAQQAALDTAAPAKIAAEPTAETLTLFEAQKHQPWTVPYGEHKWWVINDEGRLKHCLAHAAKSLGKIAAAIERLDHSNSGWLSDAECDAVGDMAADLVSVALQIGTAVHRSVAHALVRRVKEKNGALLDPRGVTYGRALICK